MLPLSIGCDIVDISRIEAVLRRQKRFLDLHFAPSEREYFARFSAPLPRIAGHFAAKEAIAKALGHGMRHPLRFSNIVIAHDAKGRPTAELLAPASHFWPNVSLEVSISHTGLVAMATALARESPDWRGPQL